MDEILPTVIAIVLVIAAVVYDWPRALAGLIVGVGARQIGRPWVLIPVGVLLTAAAGEFVYKLVGYDHQPSWKSFGLGVAVAGVCAFGLHRVLWRMYDNR